jgi:hypothetical protein
MAGGRAVGFARTRVPRRFSQSPAYVYSAVFNQRRFCILFVCELACPAGGARAEDDGRRTHDGYRRGSNGGPLAGDAATPQDPLSAKLAQAPALSRALASYTQTISPRPLLFITGDAAHSREFSEDAGSFVIPAKAGIQSVQVNAEAMDSRLRGNDGGNCGNDGGNCGNDGEIEGVTRLLTTLWSVPNCTWCPYYAPWGTIAIFYRGQPFASGLVSLGKRALVARKQNTPVQHSFTNGRSNCVHVPTSIQLLQES